MKSSVIVNSNGNPNYPYSIHTNPFNDDCKLPTWLKSLGFANEYDALMVLSLYLKMSKGGNIEVSANSFSNLIIPSVFRITKDYNSPWAKN